MACNATISRAGGYGRGLQKSVVKSRNHLPFRIDEMPLCLVVDYPVQRRRHRPPKQANNCCTASKASSQSCNHTLPRFPSSVPPTKNCAALFFPSPERPKSIFNPFTYE